ncbi:MAG: hypothetical protein ACRC20_09350 [Segniliparus sp.]|uniref:hypothetical protein n=1 Tax=Segniliparus sp. TaxID=2804064 RepID=UPI003F2BC990
MSIVGTDWHTFTAWGNGYYTVQVNIPPANVAVETALYGQSGGGTNYAGIMHYRRRLSNGTDKDIDFGAWTSWPAVFYDHISSVTFATATGSDQEAWLIGRMDYWG